MLTDDRDKALLFVMSKRPETIGVARLSQELLSSYLEEEITAPTPSLEETKIHRPTHAMVGNRNNIYGRQGKPQ